MYGGHITDDWDRRLCRTYLEEYMKPEMVGVFRSPTHYFYQMHYFYHIFDNYLIHNTCPSKMKFYYISFSHDATSYSYLNSWHYRIELC